MTVDMEMMLTEYLTKHYPALILFERLKELGHIYLIGGVLREIKDNGKIRSLRDIDIVLDTNNEAEYRNILRQYSPELNRFGGYKVECQDLIVDIWLLRQTWAYSANIIKCDQKDYSRLLPRTVFLNMDSIVYDMTNAKWLDGEYRRAMETKTLDIVLEENPFLELNIVRSFVIKEKYKMFFSDKLKAVIKNYAYAYGAKEEVVQRLYETQKVRYKKEILSKIEFDTILKDAVDD